ncbi:gluconokinase [Actinomycetota bacterium]
MSDETVSDESVSDKSLGDKASSGYAAGSTRDHADLREGHRETSANDAVGEQAVHAIVVMGVSGSGKTTLAEGLSEELGWTFAEGDDFHSDEARAKMAGGTPLTDEDRWPWLERIHAWMVERLDRGEPVIVSCSSLKRSYRDVLTGGRDDVRFLHVTASKEELERRLAERKGHYMPAKLLHSQLATLEHLADDEPGVTLVAESTPDETLDDAVEALELP